MKNLYFDFNILIDVEQNRKPALVEAIKKIDRNKCRIFFSPAHIEEIAALKMRHGHDDKKVDEMLGLLEGLTQSKAILPFKRGNIVQEKSIGVYFSEEHPKEAYARVIQNYSVNKKAENHQKEKISNGEYFQKSSGITSKEVNNSNIKKEIDSFKPWLHSMLCICAIGNSLIDKDVPLPLPACHEINFENLGKYFPLHEAAVEKIFEFLELRRFYPDKSCQFLSGLHDTSHAIYAAYCDVFVTNDKKLKQKTSVTYEWLGVATSVLTSDEFINYLAEGGLQFET